MNRIRPINPERRDALYERNFGAEADVIREQPCLVRHCCHASVPAHVIPRKMGGCGGGRFDLVPLCAYEHHEEAGEGRADGQPTTKRAAFEARYRLDLREVADRIAVEHTGGLGLRPVARVWVGRCLACNGRGGFDTSGASTECRACAGEPMTMGIYERAALFGWAKRWADRAAFRFTDPHQGYVMQGLTEVDPSESRAHACSSVARALEIDLADAVTLLDAAGWPEVTRG